MVRPLENLTVTEGQPLRLSCTLSKDNCRVSCLKDEQEININPEIENNRFVTTNDGRIYRLEVRQSKRIDAGIYASKGEDWR